MKLNDPFGRMESRHQRGYKSMVETMRSSGVETEEAAQKIIQLSKKNALKYVCIILVLLLPILVLLPKMMPVTVSLAVFLVFWIANSTLNGQRYIQRYIEEELK